jgi:hypothetical protein
MITSNARAEFTTKTTSLFGSIRWRDLRLVILLQLLDRYLHTIVDKLKVCKRATRCAWICASWSAGTSPACVGRRA